MPLKPGRHQKKESSRLYPCVVTQCTQLLTVWEITDRCVRYSCLQRPVPFRGEVISFIFSSPEPKAPGEAYRIGSCPSPIWVT